MPIIATVRESKLLRSPLIRFCELLLKPLRQGPGVLRRAVYDSLPLPYFVAGTREFFVVSTQDKVIGKRLFLSGEFDFEKLHVALSILKREGYTLPRHLIDVGANVGSIVIPAIKRGLFETASAIEPHPANLLLLRTNLALNGIEDKVSVFPFAAGAESNTKLLLHESSTNHGNHSIGASGIDVSGMRLDDLDIPIDRSLLWMDIEGYEGHALNGANRILATGAAIVAEFNPHFLNRAGGFELFDQALGQRRIFDLGDSGRAASIHELTKRYRDGYTDILAV